MDKISFVGYVALAIIIISILNMGVEMTGRTVHDNATVNVTIDTTTAINFTTDLIEFGNGLVYANSSGSVTLDSNASGHAVGGNWTQPGTSFTLENIGNQNVSVDLYSWKSAANFIGGSSPAYNYAYADNEAGSCTNQTNQSDWYAFTQASGDTICNPLLSKDSTDTIDINVQIAIPSDSLTGTQTDTVTAEATAV